jgi:hypothetical protein
MIWTWEMGMIIKRLYALCAMLIAFDPAAAQAASERLVLAPASAWVLDYAEERCSLIRTFGNGEDAVRFQIDSFGRHEIFRVQVVGKPITTGRAPMGEVQYRLTPDPELRAKISTLEGKAGDLPAIAILMDFGPAVEGIEDLSPEEILPLAEDYKAKLPTYRKAVESIELRFRFDKFVQLELGPMGPPLEALSACIDDLQAHWGFDPDKLRQLSRPPTPTPETVRRVQSNYPSSALMDGISAYVPVRIKVDAEGSATECVVQSEAVDEQFKRSVCPGMARGFEPALDIEGTPVASLYQTAVTYVTRLTRPRN